MCLRRQDMIDIIIRSFNDYDYGSAIIKRLGFGFNMYALTCSECTSLNSIVKELNNKMLDEVYFYSSISLDNFDVCISRLLYVAGKWTELCIYNMLIMNEIKNDIVSIDYSTIFTTTAYVYFRYDSKTIKMCVDDEKIGIKIETITMQEKEF